MKIQFKIKKFAKFLLNPNIRPQFFTIYRKKNSFTSCTNWAEAIKQSNSFDSNAWIEKLRVSAGLVRDGKAAYERDTVIFSEIEYCMPLINSLLEVAKSSDNLCIIDYGGSLGTTFHQNYTQLSQFTKKIDWRIVELPKIASLGRQEFTNKYLSFYDNIDDAKSDEVNAILFCGSINYIEDCYNLLIKAIALKVPHIIFDRTSIANGSIDTFHIQHVFPPILRGDFPIRNIAFNNLLDVFEKNYTLINKWENDTQENPEATHMGFHFKLI